MHDESLYTSDFKVMVPKEKSEDCVVLTVRAIEISVMSHHLHLVSCVWEQIFEVQSFEKINLIHLQP